MRRDSSIFVQYCVIQYGAALNFSYGYENERISIKNKKKQKEFVSVAFFRSIIQQPITKGKF